MAQPNPDDPYGLGLRPLDNPDDPYNLGLRPLEPPQEEEEPWWKKMATSANAARFIGSAAGDIGMAIPVVGPAMPFIGGAIGEGVGQVLGGEPISFSTMALEGGLNYMPGAGKLERAGLGELGKYALKSAKHGAIQGAVGTFPRHQAAQGNLLDPSQWEMPSAGEFAGQTVAGGVIGGATGGILGAAQQNRLNRIANASATPPPNVPPPPPSIDPNAPPPPGQVYPQLYPQGTPLEKLPRTIRIQNPSDTAFVAFQRQRGYVDGPVDADGSMTMTRRDIQLTSTSQTGAMTRTTAETRPIIDTIANQSGKDVYVIAGGQKLKVQPSNMGGFGRSIGGDIRLADGSEISVDLVDSVVDASGNTLWAKKGASSQTTSTGRQITTNPDGSQTIEIPNPTAAENTALKTEGWQPTGKVGPNRGILMTRASATPQATPQITTTPTSPQVTSAPPLVPSNKPTTIPNPSQAFIDKVLKRGYTVTRSQDGKTVTITPPARNIASRFISEDEGTFEPQQMWENLKRFLRRDPTPEELDAAMARQVQPGEETGRVAPFEGRIRPEGAPRPEDVTSPYDDPNYVESWRPTQAELDASRAGRDAEDLADIQNGIDPNTGKLIPPQPGPEGIAISGYDKPVPPQMGQQELPLGPSSEMRPRELESDAWPRPVEDLPNVPEEGGLDVAPLRQQNLFESSRPGWDDETGAVNIGGGGGEGFWSRIGNSLLMPDDTVPPARPPQQPPSLPPPPPPTMPPSMAAEVPPPTKSQGRGRQWYNLARGLTTPLDLSGSMRQGLAMITRKEWWTSWKQQIQALGSDGAFYKALSDIEEKPEFTRMTDTTTGDELPSLADKAGMKMMDIDDTNFTNREEAQQSSWAEDGGFLAKIPGAQKTWARTVGRGVRASNRAYVAFLNQLRADTFTSLIQDAKKQFDAGVKGSRDPYTDIPFAKEIADYVNTATGRGPLRISFTGKGEYSFEQSTKILTDGLFSPKLFFAHARMLSPGTYAMASPFVRRQYFRSLLSVAGAWGTVSGLAAMAGAEVSLDPNSADFGKIKIPGTNTRIDPAGGFQQYLVAASRLLTGHDTSSATGRSFETGVGYRADTRGDIAQRFMANKLHPVVKFAYDLLYASHYQPFHVGDRTAQMFVPLIVQDALELTREDPTLLPWLVPVAMGMGTQTYGKGEPGARKQPGTPNYETEGKLVPQEYDYSFEGGGIDDPFAEPQSGFGQSGFGK